VIEVSVMQRRSRLGLLALSLIVALVIAGPATACPMCKDALARSRDVPADPTQVDASRLGEGISYSILFMMAMPFVVAGAGGLAVVRAVRRGQLPEL
jgi:hypothetical protein